MKLLRKRDECRKALTSSSLGVRRWLAVAAVACLPGLALGVAESGRFKPLFADPLDAPAALTVRAPKIETVGAAQAGKALVAVGARGAILRSTDGGSNWKQSAAPVSADLVSVFFINENKGWAVGHDAVILHTQDGGQTWTRQLEGRAVARMMRASYQRLQQESDYARESLKILDKIAPTEKSVLPLPFLDVWFANESEGYAIGAFNLLFHTADGGKTWEPRDHLTDNRDGYHLNAIKSTPAGLMIVGERGLVLRLDKDSGRFIKVSADYAGSYFGLHADAQRIVVYGLRGNARISRDGGKQWDAVKLNTVGNIVKVTASGADGLLYILQDGAVMRQDATGAIHEVKVLEKRPGEIAGALMLEGDKLLTMGIRGPVVSSLSNVTEQASVK